MTMILIVGNIIFAVLLALFWTKHSILKKTSEAEISRLKQEVEEGLIAFNSAESRMRNDVSSDNQKNESLTQELTAVRKEKEEELKLRMEAEKQIVLAIQKADDIQKRMIDWKSAQEAAMKDSQNAIIQVGENLYHRINASYQNEIQNNQNIFNKILDCLANKNTTIAQMPSPVKEPPESTEIFREAIPAETVKSEPVQKSATPNTNTPYSTKDLTKQLLAKLTQTMQDSTREDGQHYFSTNAFDSDKSKLFLCEAAFIQDSHLYIFDFKACNFLQDFLSNANKEAVLPAITSKLDKYIAYLNNPKYRAAILKALASKNAAFDNGDIVVVTPSHEALEVLEEIGYLEKLEDTGVKVAAFDEILDLAL